jgi:ABC-type sugar transport system ATPase subunit
VTAGVAVEGLTFSYARGVAPAVSDVALAVDPGEIVAVVGPSGSGKTTLLRLISGLLSPASGRVSVGGRDVTSLPPERRPVAMVFQGFALFPHLDVAANIGFGLAVRKTPRAEREARVRAVAERLGIDALLARKPGELSGGERQRVALGRALVRDPVVFCLDEPLSSLDPILRTNARRDLNDLLRQDGRCAVYVTHDQTEAMMLSDRVAVIREGRVEQLGTIRDLYDHPETAFVASFIGDPPMSLLPAGTAGLVGKGDVFTIGVHAEHVRLVPGDAVTITVVDDLGHEQIAELDLGPGLLRARVPRSQSVHRGDRTGFSVAPEHVHSFDAQGRAIR